PLKGLPGTRATDVSYRASVPAGHAGRGVALSYRALAPGGAGFYRICTGTSESRLTAHYSLLTANSTYTFSAKEKDSETGLSYFGPRYYSSDLSVWLSVDPMAAKYPSLSPYVYCADNPVKLVDPNGEEISEHIDKYGNIIAHYDDGDNSVYLHKSGTTEADISTQRRVLNNTGGEGKKVGELGGNIDQSGFFDNKLQLSAQYARKISKMGIVNRYISFYEKVKTNGDWDLKNNNSNNHQSPMRTIWGIAWKYEQDNGTNTTFSCDYFSNASAADVGNFHAGYVGVISGFSDEMLFRGAGIAEVVKLGRRHDPTFKEHFVELIWGKSCKYGDQQQDYLYNALGMEYAKKNR
ncbi:MAG: hypothetical protein IKQ52_02195, partial [Bacteroidales bacterium]|nr:hypothetical protein [Bacteroidales bacterium]